MIFQIAAGFYDYFNVKISDTLDNELASFAVPDVAITYSDNKYYLEYAPTANRIRIRTYSGEILIEDYFKDVQLEDTPQQNLLVEWHNDVADKFNTWARTTYYVYRKTAGIEQGLALYTPVGDTISHVNFSTYSPDTIYDTNNVPMFSYSGADHTIGSPLTTDLFAGGAGKLTSLNANYSSTTGFTIGFLYNAYFKFESDAITIETVDDEGNVTIVVSDGVTSITTSNKINFGSWNSAKIVVKHNRVYLIINGVVEDMMVIDLDVFSLLPLAITSYNIHFNGITELFIESFPMSVDRMSNVCVSNKKTLIGTTNAYEFMIPTDTYPGNYRKDEILVEGWANENDKKLKKFEKRFQEQDIVILYGDYCFIWDDFLTYADNRSGLYFYVGDRDVVDSPFTHIKEKHAPVNLAGYFGIYLPYDVIYTTRLNDGAKLMRFVIPRQKEARLRDVGQWYGENRYFS